MIRSNTCNKVSNGTLLGEIPALDFLASCVSLGKSGCLPRSENPDGNTCLSRSLGGISEVPYAGTWWAMGSPEMLNGTPHAAHQQLKIVILLLKIIFGGITCFPLGQTAYWGSRIITEFQPVSQECFWIPDGAHLPPSASGFPGGDMNGELYSLIPLFEGRRPVTHIRLDMWVHGERLERLDCL